MSSTRLPGKIFLKVNSRYILDYLIDRLSFSKRIDNLIIATTTNPKDKIITEYCKKNNIIYFEGSEENVLSRYYLAAKKYNVDIIVRITSDCPLIDPGILDKMLDFYNKNSYDFVSNTVPPPSNYPDGMDVEIFNFETLKKTYQNAQLPSEKEHVTFYMWKSKNFDIYKFSLKHNFSKYRLTLDYIEDFELISEIIRCLYKKNSYFNMSDIIKFLQNNKHLFLLNNKFIRNESWKKSLEIDKNL